MGWLLLVALVTMWAAFLFPSWRGSPGTWTDKSMKDFERNMDMLAETEAQGLLGLAGFLIFGMRYYVASPTGA